MKGIVGSEIRDLVSYNNRLYAKTPREIVYSTDNGETWLPVQIDSGKGTGYYPAEFTVVDDNFYALARDSLENIRICQMSSDGDEFVPIQELPEIGGESFIKKLGMEPIEKDVLPNIDEETELSEEQIRALMARLNRTRIRTLAGNKNTFYLEVNEHLFKAEIGDSEWTNTELDFGKEPDYGRLTIAVSDNNIFVGRGDAHLIQSVDDGKNWMDITPIIPIQLIGFQDIEIVESKVYVATYRGY